MAAIDPQGGEAYNIDGTTFEGVRNQATDTGTEKYWFQGKSEENLFPLNNGDTGKFFLLFE
jgi:hypothetical protein